MSVMIKAFLCDLDGVLTDGCYYRIEPMREGHTTPEGWAANVGPSMIGRKFNTRDWHGMMLLSEMGVTIAIVTAAGSTITEHQARAVPFEVEVMSGVKDKKKAVEERFIKSKGLKWSEIAYIGDDEPDIPLLMKVGVAACPIDAEESVIKALNRREDAMVLERRGGNACVREFANYIRRINDV